MTFKKLTAGLGRKLSSALVALLFAASISYAAFNVGFDGIILPQSLSTPVLTACGTTPTIVGNNVAGKITLGTTATGCVVTFTAGTYLTEPNCLVSWIATPLASQSYATTATAITITQTSTTNNIVKYICTAAVGG